MEEKQSTQQNVSLPIEKAYTFFMVPFYYDSNTVDDDIEKSERWELEQVKLSNEGEDGDVLYPYIMHFLQGQIDEKSNSMDYLDIYRLKVNKESDWYRFFWSRFTNYASEAQIPMGRNAAKEFVFHRIPFKLLSGDENGFKAPHLFLYQVAKIGILTFCVEIQSKIKNITDLKMLNYHLHKIHSPLCRCTALQLSINTKVKFENDEERQKYENNIKTARTFIAPFDAKEEHSPYGEFSWSIKGLIDMWLKDVNHKLFSNIRTHVFTYCQINDSQNEILEKKDLLPEVIKLSRCVNDKYFLAYDELEKNGAVFQSFDNIYMASSVEGTAIIAVAKKTNKGFVSQMDAVVKARYIWVYLLVMIQRYALLNMNRQLMEIDTNNNEDALWDVLKIIKSVKVRCYYTDVSPYTQHGQFYQLCCKNLHIKETFNEIEQKTKVLNLTISHDIQKLLQKQQKSMQQQHMEIEKREKEQEKEIRKAERRAESSQHRLNLVVGILTVFQVAEAVFAFTENVRYRVVWVLLTFVLCFFLLFIVMKWEQRSIPLIKWVRKIYFKGNDESYENYQ